MVSEALELTLRALEGRLRPEDAALVALAKGLARAVETNAENAALWREYRAALAQLMERTDDSDSDDGFEQLLAAVRAPTVLDTPNR